MNYKSVIVTGFLLVGGIVNSNAQDIDTKDVPAAVKTAFKSTYAKATDVDWELKGSNYEVDFEIARIDHKATYTSAGKLISLEKDISNNQLPAAVLKSIKAKYPNGKIDGANWISTAGKISYKVDIDGTPDVNAWYDATGRFIKEVAD